MHANIVVLSGVDFFLSHLHLQNSSWPAQYNTKNCAKKPCHTPFKLTSIYRNIIIIIKLIKEA